MAKKILQLQTFIENIPSNMDFHQSINFQQTNIHHQVDGQEIPTDGCGAKISSNQFLLAGGRTCPNCAFVYNSDSGVILLVMIILFMII